MPASYIGFPDAGPIHGDSWEQVFNPLILRLALWMEATFFSITYTSNESNILPLLSSTLQFHFLPQLVKKPVEVLS